MHGLKCSAAAYGGGRVQQQPSSLFRARARRSIVAATAPLFKAPRQAAAAATAEVEWWRSQPGDDDYVPGGGGNDDDDGDNGTPSYASNSGRNDRGNKGKRDGKRGGGQQQQQRSSSARGGSSGNNGRQQQRSWQRDDDSDDDDEEGPGWWELPRSVRNAIPEATPLERWQEDKLIVAFERGRRRVSVQQLAADLGLDRSEVTSWFKAHAAAPREAREARAKPLAREIAAAKAAAAEEAKAKQQQQQQQQQQKGKQQQQDAAQEQAAAPTAAKIGDLLAPVKGPNTGFVPFAQRAGRPAFGGAGRRLAADALRTLEAMYARTPYPTKDALAAACTLHKLPRAMAAEWFVQRREADGRPHDPRLAKRLADEAEAAAAAAAFGPSGGMGDGRRRVARGPAPGASDELARLMRTAAADAAAAAAATPADDAVVQQQQQQQQPAARPQRVVSVTSRGLASLVSSLPSPRKLKGAKLAEALDIKPVEIGKGAGKGGSGSGLEIGGVVYVVRSGEAAWRRAWQRRRGSRGEGGGVPAQRLDFVRWGRAGGSGSGNGSD